MVRSLLGVVFGPISDKTSRHPLDRSDERFNLLGFAERFSIDNPE